MTDGETDTARDLNDVARENMGRLLMVVVAALVLKLAFRTWNVLIPGSWVAVVVVVHLYGTALGLLLLAVADVDIDRWGHWIALWVGFEVAMAAGLVVWLRPGTHFGTDALLFSRYSVHLLLTGRNPYAESMLPATAIYNANILHVTPQVDGSAISSLSYPGGMVLWFLPQGVTGWGDTTFAQTLYIAIVAVMVYLILESPSVLALAPIAVLLGSRNLVWATGGGLLDVLWVLPLLFSMRYWSVRRLAPAAFAFGLAAGTKQTVWPIAAFLAIWLWAEAADVDAFLADAKTTLGYGFAGFLALNLPFLLWNPKMWVYGVLTPIGRGSEMIHQGVGPTLFSIAGLYALPKTYHVLLVVLATVAALALYALYWDRVKWAAWVVPPILLFFYHRSLNSYYVFFLPVAYYAALCALDLRRRDSLLGKIAALVLSAAFVLSAEKMQEGVPDVEERQK